MAAVGAGVSKRTLAWIFAVGAWVLFFAGFFGFYGPPPHGLYVASGMWAGCAGLAVLILQATD